MSYPSNYMDPRGRPTSPTGAFPVQPAYPPNYQPAYTPPPGPPVVKSKPITIVLVILSAFALLAALFVYVVFFMDRTGSMRHAPVGTAYVDEKFEITVTAARCGSKSVGEQGGLSKDAKGQFCFIDISVKNTAIYQQTFNPGIQKVHATNGKSYKHDATAESYYGHQIAVIQRDETKAGTLVFDIPGGAAISTVEIHAGRGSEGFLVVSS